MLLATCVYLFCQCMEKADWRSISETAVRMSFDVGALPYFRVVDRDFFQQRSRVCSVFIDGAFMAHGHTDGLLNTTTKPLTISQHHSIQHNIYLGSSS